MGLAEKIRQIGVTLHVPQNTGCPGGSAIDGRARTIDVPAVNGSQLRPRRRGCP